ncbi:unnamed protein product [Bursaphelenchus xylophilus]|uniref:(pine wood nematode) hypothetical protein n=1 Tax=Bursaphelenchus xylophilus TaxID=6326 RepID=A0A1I7RRU1_BURXY|nr:unnamed protein product [Bursaphelenchus xylophilus]CAG9123476.1 unnamed protein product [Bursaphelenchus xylophilus]
MSLSTDRNEQNLKGRYFKYLESLCVSNGIEMDKLKAMATDYELLEMFFGGLPVLVGLRYFDHLQTLRLMGQEIQNLSPLSEVAETLEELWICECSLDDIAGMEACTKIRRLYLYSNRIHDASVLSYLKSLDILWIQDNQLDSLEFLKDLQYLSSLKVGGDQFNDSLALSISQWPPKLQFLDIAGNTLSSFQSLLSLSCCEVLRRLNICNDKYPSNGLIREEEQLVWLTFHFPFLESFDGDTLNEKFISNYTMQAEKKAALEMNSMIKSSRKMIGQLDSISKNEAKMQEKLSSFINALTKASSVVSKKEGRRELTLKLHDLYNLKLKALPNSQAGCIKCEKEVFYISNYLLPSWKMESAGRTMAREAPKTELLDLEQTLQGFCTIEEPKIKIKTAVLFSLTPLDKTEMKNLFFLHPSSETAVWDFADLIEIGNQRLAMDGNLKCKVFKDLSSLSNESYKTLCTCSWPLVKVKANAKAEKIEDQNNNSYEAQGKDECYYWGNLELVFLCVIELQRSSWPTFEEVKNIHHFDEHINNQVKTLKDLGIELKLEKVVLPLQKQATEEEGAEGETQEIVKPKQQNKVSEIITEKLTSGRYRINGPIWSGKELSLRNPIELTLAYTKSAKVEESNMFSQIVALNLENLNINSLDGIEQLEKLRYLSLASNNLLSVKRLRKLDKLLFLDISQNNISKIDELPGSLCGLKAFQNQLTSVTFCSKLQLLTYLNLSHNRIKSMKGIEELKTLHTLLLTDNMLKDKTEVELLQELPNLRFVDLMGNPLADDDNYKKVVLNGNNSNAENENSSDADKQNQVVRKAGKILTMDFLEKEFGESLGQENEFNWSDHQFQMIALDRTALDKLQNITAINLSNNHLQHLYELVHLHNLVDLDLSSNQIISLTTENLPEILPKLEVLNFSSNNLTCQSLARVGLAKLPQLKRLILSGNKLTRFDGDSFDLERLESLDLSDNDIKIIRKKTLKNIKEISLANNGLKDLEGLSLPNVTVLNVSKNKISSCAAMKSLKDMKHLKSLDCSENPVTARRVYIDYIKKQLPGLEELDSEVVIRTVPETNKEESNGTEKPRIRAHIKANPMAVQIANSKSSAAKRYIDFKLLKEKSDVTPEMDPQDKQNTFQSLQKSQSLFNLMAPEATNLNVQDFIISGKRITKYSRVYKMN